MRRRNPITDHLHRLTRHRAAEPVEPVRRRHLRLGGREVPVEPGADDELDPLEDGQVAPQRDRVAYLGGSGVLIPLNRRIVPEVLDEPPAPLGDGDDLPDEGSPLEVRVVDRRATLTPGVGAVEDDVPFGSEDEEIDGAGLEVSALFPQHALPFVGALEPDLPDEVSQPDDRPVHELLERLPVDHVGGGDFGKRNGRQRLPGARQILVVPAHHDQIHSGHRGEVLERVAVLAAGVVRVEGIIPTPLHEPAARRPGGEDLLDDGVPVVVQHPVHVLAVEVRVFAVDEHLTVGGQEDQVHVPDVIVAALRPHRLDELGSLVDVGDGGGDGRCVGHEPLQGLAAHHLTGGDLGHLCVDGGRLECGGGQTE